MTYSAYCVYWFSALIAYESGSGKGKVVGLENPVLLIALIKSLHQLDEHRQHLCILPFQALQISLKTSKSMRSVVKSLSIPEPAA